MLTSNYHTLNFTCTLINLINFSISHQFFNWIFFIETSTTEYLYSICSAFVCYLENKINKKFIFLIKILITDISSITFSNTSIICISSALIEFLKKNAIRKDGKNIYYHTIVPMLHVDMLFLLSQH